VIHLSDLDWLKGLVLHKSTSVSPTARKHKK